MNLKMLWKLVLITALLITSSQEILCNQEHIPVIAIELSKNGFHRDLVYNLKFDYRLAGKNCVYAVEQHFPAAVYISVDQLNDLKRLKKLNAIYPEFVDIEASTEKATPFTVILKGVPKSNESIKLPIHYRYHAPSSDGTHVEVELTTPLVYIKCHSSHDEHIDEELLVTPNIRHCLEGSNSIFTTYSAEATSSRSELDCNWSAINVDFQIKNPLIAKIPVGKAKSFPPILYATIICSWLISFWTVFRTRAVPRSINQKLEEQRVLSRKTK